jgi:hypothetical protein
MKGMQIVIDISEEEYNRIKENDCELYNGRFFKMIRNGIPLPKGHGKLFDVNDLLDRIGLEDNESNRDENVGEIVTLEDFDYIPTIIPADTESEE